MDSTQAISQRIRLWRPQHTAAWLSLGAMCVAALGFWPGDRPLLLPLLVTVLGGVCLTLALRRVPEHQLMQPVTAVEPMQDQRTLRWPPIALGIMCLTLLGLRGSAQVISPLLFQLTPIHVQAMLLFAGIALLVIGVGGVHRHDIAACRQFLPVHRREIYLLLAIMGLALAVRAYDLEAVRILMDEGPFISAIMKMRQDPLVSLTALLHPIASSTRLFPWTQLILADLFGSTIGVFRLGAVLYGVFTVGATYGLARLLFDRRTAFIAALLLATFPPHIHMSRIAIYNIADPLFGVLALAFFTRALQTQRRLDYALAGAALGLLPYFFEAGELLFPLLLLAWIIWLRISRAPGPTRRGLTALLAVAVPVALPVYYTIVSFQLPLFTRLDAAHASDNYMLEVLTSTNGFEQIVDFINKSIIPPFLHYFHAPDPSLFYNGQTALVLPVFVPLLLLGLGFSLWRPRRGGMLLILWLGLTALGNSLLLINNWTPRFVVAMPALALLMALGLRCILPLLLHAPRWRLYKGLTLAICLVQVLYYYGLHLPYYQQQIIDLRQHYDVVYRILALPEDVDVVFIYKDTIQIAFTYDLLDFLGNTRPFYADLGNYFDPAALDRSKNHVIFVDTKNQAVLDRMEAVWYLDGPHFGSPDLPVIDQIAAYRVTPWLWREGVEIPPAEDS